MNNKLNEDYFETKKKHQKGYKNRRKIKLVERIGYVLLTFILIFVYGILNKQCQNKIEHNKTKDLYEQQSLDTLKQ